MAKIVNMHEAKTNLSRLAERASLGERIVIARNGAPVATLGPIESEREPRRLGLLEGQITVSDDFDDPLPDDILSALQGDER